MTQPAHGWRSHYALLMLLFIYTMSVIDRQIMGGLAFALTPRPHSVRRLTPALALRPAVPLAAARA